MTAGRIAVAVVLIVAVGSFFVFDLGRFLTFETLESLRTDSAVARFIAEYPGWSRAVYFGIFVTIAAFPLPVAGVMTVAGGAIFGLGWGLVLASFASAISSALAFLVSRKLLGEWVQRRFAKELAGVNAGVKRDGGFYLFSLRMVPLIPFFALNLVMGLTRMGLFSFYAVSQAGMLAVIFIYVFAGTRLAEVKSPGDVLDAGLIAAVVLLGLFPLAAKRLIAWINRRREEVAR